MIKLTRDTDSIFPYGLRGTPFEVVYKAIQSVAGDVWDVDPTAYRAAIAWGYYLTHAPEVLVDCQAGREFVANVLVSEQAPLVKDTQTTEELVELLRLWRDYSPTFEKLEALYEPYAARVDIRPITDADSWQALPLDDTAGAFYVVITELDWARPLTLGEARTIALRATPMGSQPHAIFFFEESSTAYARPSFGDVTAYVIETELPAPPPPVPPQPTQVFDYAGNFTLGEIIQSDSVAGGQGYLSSYLVVTPLYESRGWNAGGNLNMAYFTNAGSAETQNTELDYYESYRLYDENGNAITYRAANEEYRITSAFRINKGSSAALWNQSDLNTWLKLQQVGQMFAYTEEESGIPSDTDIYSLMYSIHLQPIIIDLKLKSDGSAATFSANDYWYSYFRDQSDQAKATKYGMAISDGQLADSNLTAFNINILALLDSSGNNVQADLSNFSVGSGSGKVRILSTDAYTTSVSFWRVYVTKEQVVYTRLMLFLRSSNYQTVNKSVTANSSNVLYAEGSDAMYTVSDLTQKYILTGAYSNTGATIDITGCKLTVLANGRLTLDWGDTAANVCYITALTEAPFSITVLLGLRYDGNAWLSKTFDADDYWWPGILSDQDKALVESIGLSTDVQQYQYGGPIGSIVYNAGYTYQILGLFSDINGTQEVQTDLSNLYVAPHAQSGYSTQYACICNNTAITTPSMTWKVKITKN